MKLRTLITILLVLGAVVAAGADEVIDSFWGGGKEFCEFQTIEGPKRWELSIMVAPNGNVIAGGAVLSEDGGDTWQPINGPEGLAGTGGFYIDDNTGDILRLNSNDNPQLWLYRSKDNGKTWAKETIVRHVDKNGWLTTNMCCTPGITLKYGEHKGRLLGASRTFINNKHPKFPQQEHFDCYSSSLYSDDGGKTWFSGDPFPFPGTGEAGLVELADGTIYYNSRTHVLFGNRLIARSYDGGQSWKEGQMDPYLPDGPPDFYGCKGGLTRLPSDNYDILLFSQNNDPGGDTATHSTRGRGNLKVWVSFDGGKTWPVSRFLHETGGYTELAAGRMGTPSEGKIYMLCHSGHFARFNLAWITEGKNWREFLPEDKK